MKRLPVLHEGRLVGILSRGDLVRAFARSDAEIEEDIRQEVLLHSLSMSPDELDIEVDEGEIALRGEVDAEFRAQLLPPEIQRVPGVVAVRSELTTRGRPAARATARRGGD